MSKRWNGQDRATVEHGATSGSVSSLVLGMVVAIALIAGTAGIVVALTRTRAPAHSSIPIGTSTLSGPRMNQISMTDLPPAGGKGGDPGDDYPWKNVPMDSELDPWREYVRECTSFVAWALHSRNGFEMPFYGDASTWGTQASRRGFAVNHTPSPGAVAWEDSGDHVAWVSSVSGSSITIEEYNEHYNGTYDQRTLTSYGNFEFIHFKDLPTVSSAPPAAPAPASTPAASASPSAPSTQGSPSAPSGTSSPSQPRQPSTAAPNGASSSPPSPPSPSTSSSGSSGASVETSQSPTPTTTVTPTTPATTAETVGGVSHTWADYSDAGGAQGPSIPTNETVQIACTVTGFKVADGNTWWYRIASDPWSSAYYVSADAFYNNGATSGSLIGTPFVDPSVPNC
jgi:surface antigen